MKKKIIIAGICIIALCAVIVPKFTKPKQFAQAVALPVMDAEKPETGDIRLTTSVIGKIEPSEGGEYQEISGGYRASGGCYH